MGSLRIAPALLALALAARADGEAAKPAAPAAEPLRDPIARLLDADGDGALSAEELKGAGAALLSKDTDKDGALSREELKAGGLGGEEGAPRRGGMLARFDSDGDGRISRDEAPEWLKQGFGEIDRNGDGFLDEEELRAMRGRRRGGRGGREGAPGQEGARPEWTGRGRTGPTLLALLDADRDLSLSAKEIENAPKALLDLDKGGDGALSREELAPPPRPLAGLDRDGDGRISREEASERLKRRFDELDKDKDGFLDEAELKALDAVPGPSDREPE